VLEALVALSCSAEMSFDDQCEVERYCAVAGYL